METAAALPPTRATLVRRWALVVLPFGLVLLVIWGVLDVPENYNCGDSKPDGQEERLRSFREVAFPLLGLLTIWVAGVSARWAVERERRPRFPGRRTAIAVAAFVLVGLIPFALGSVEIGTLPEELPVLWLVGSLIASALAGFVAAVLAIVATGSVAPRELSVVERERSDTVLLLFAVALLIAMPSLAVVVAYQGSGWVVGC